MLLSKFDKNAWNLSSKNSEFNNRFSIRKLNFDAFFFEIFCNALFFKRFYMFVYFCHRKSFFHLMFFYWRLILNFFWNNYCFNDRVSQSFQFAYIPELWLPGYHSDSRADGHLQRNRIRGFCSYWPLLAALLRLFQDLLPGAIIVSLEGENSTRKMMIFSWNLPHFVSTLLHSASTPRKF